MFNTQGLSTFLIVLKLASQILCIKIPYDFLGVQLGFTELDEKISYSI